MHLNVVLQKKTIVHVHIHNVYMYIQCVLTQYMMYCYILSFNQYNACAISLSDFVCFFPVVSSVSCGRETRASTRTHHISR